MNRKKNTEALIEGIELTMCRCASVANGHQLLDVLSSLGCDFVRGFSSEIDPHPELRTKATGSIVAPVRFRHPRLGTDLLSKSKLPIAGVTFLTKSRTVCIHQAVDSRGKGWNEIADGQLDFARLLYNRLKPSYGWIDASSEFPMPESIESLDDMAFLFWANVLGPQIVSNLTKSFLQSCPNMIVEYMTDGGAIVSGSESFSEWVRGSHTGSISHFAQKAQQLKLFKT